MVLINFSNSQVQVSVGDGRSGGELYASSFMDRQGERVTFHRLSLRPYEAVTIRLS
jgi:hypothetical protein